jgi:hypothetical protein
MTHERFLASVTYLEGLTMKWFPNSRRRADADARRRHVRPALESLESRIVPEGSGIPTFNQGVAYATQTLANVGSSPQSHVLTDLTLITNAWDDAAFNASIIEMANLNIQATNKLIGGLQIPGMMSIAALQQEINFSFGMIQSDYGIISVAKADLLANWQALEAMLLKDAGIGLSPSPPASPGGLAGTGGGGYGGGSGGLGLGGL